MDFLDAGVPRASSWRPGRRVEPGHAARPLRPRRWSRSASGRRPSSFTLHATNPAHDLAHRRRLGRLRLGGQRAERARPRPRPAGRQPGRLPGPHPPAARCSTVVHFFAGYPVEPVDIHASVRHLVRHPRPADPGRQADPRLLAGPAAQHRRARDGPHRARRRRRDAGARAVDLHGHQLVARRCGSTRRCSRASSSSRARNQVVVHDAVHAGRRHGAGDPRRRARRAERRGAGRAWS